MERCPRLATVRGDGATGDERRSGLTLIEISISVAVISVILLGVMASMSSGFIANNQNEEFLESQLLVQQVLEEIRDNDFDDLLSFNGQFVTSGSVRADLSVSQIGVDLMRVQVNTTSTLYPTVTAAAVTYVANRN